MSIAEISNCNVHFYFIFFMNAWNLGGGKKKILGWDFLTRHFLVRPRNILQGWNYFTSSHSHRCEILRESKGDRSRGVSAETDQQVEAIGRHGRVGVQGCKQTAGVVARRVAVVWHLQTQVGAAAALPGDVCLSKTTHGFALNWVRVTCLWINIFSDYLGGWILGVGARLLFFCILDVVFWGRGC